jgi:hypothetical protein
VLYFLMNQRERTWLCSIIFEECATHSQLIAGRSFFTMQLTLSDNNNSAKPTLVNRVSRLRTH